MLYFLKKSKKNKILIFRTDRIGDLINTSSFFKSIKDYYKDSEVTLVCSKYNSIVASRYPFIDKILIYEKSLSPIKKLKFFINVFLNIYDLTIALDGKKMSYLVSSLTISKFKYAVCFKKQKKILNFYYNTFRPSKFTLKLFFTNYIICDENYNNKSVNLEFNNHYLTMYYYLLKKNNISLNPSNHIYLHDVYFESCYKNFLKKNITKNFLLIHIDEKWDKLNLNLKWFNDLLIKISDKYQILISSGINNSNLFNTLKSNYKCFQYANNSLNSNSKHDENENIILLDKLNLSLIAYFIEGCSLFISSHSGATFHISSALEKPTFDFVMKNIDLELNRWIPLNMKNKYKRIFSEEYEVLESEIKKVLNF